MDVIAQSAAAKYRTIVADPPWRVMGGPLKGGHGEGFIGTAASRPLPYVTMTVEQVAALPVAQLAAADCALYLWTINAYLEHAYNIARAWGFKPSTLLTWCKAPMGAGLGGAFGITTEFILYARRGSPVERRTTGTWYRWKRHYINGKPAHSAKPDAFYDLVEQVSDGPYVDLFARRARLGWDCWGDESAGTARMDIACPTCPASTPTASPNGDRASTSAPAATAARSPSGAPPAAPTAGNPCAAESATPAGCSSADPTTASSPRTAD